MMTMTAGGGVGVCQMRIFSDIGFSPPPKVVTSYLNNPLSICTLVSNSNANLMISKNIPKLPALFIGLLERSIAEEESRLSKGLPTKCVTISFSK